MIMLCLFQSPLQVLILSEFEFRVLYLKDAIMIPSNHWNMLLKRL